MRHENKVENREALILAFGLNTKEIKKEIRKIKKNEIKVCCYCGKEMFKRHYPQHYRIHRKNHSKKIST